MAEICPFDCNSHDCYGCKAKDSKRIVLANGSVIAGISIDDVSDEAIEQGSGYSLKRSRIDCKAKSQGKGRRY